MLNTLKIIAAAAIAATLGYSVGHYRGEESGAAKAELKAANNFNSAVGELSNEADKARVKRGMCIADGRLYDFRTGKCAKDTGG